MLRMHRELDELFGRTFGQQGSPVSYDAEAGEATWWPAIESYTKDGQIHVRVALPGVEPKDVEISVLEDHLTIRGERKATTEDKTGGRYLREFAYGSFERTLALPDGIDPNKVQAKFSNGMLDLTMPAPVAVVPRKVTIQIEGAADQAKGVKAA
jgi:HSP20 family protein